jgi:hypothetical protein
MEIYLFYLTHLIMMICFIVIISIVWEEHKPMVIKNGAGIISGISPIKKLKAIYRTIGKKEIWFKSLIVNSLYIGMQMYNQLFK